MVWWQLLLFLFILSLSVHTFIVAFIQYNHPFSSISSIFFIASSLIVRNLPGVPSRDLNSGALPTEPRCTLKILILLILSGSRVWSWRGSETGERWRRGGTIRTSTLSTTGRTSTPRSTSLSTWSCDASASTSATGELSQ
jgi:hypothetical protein